MPAARSTAIPEIRVPGVYQAVREQVGVRAKQGDPRCYLDPVLTHEQVAEAARTDPETQRRFAILAAMDRHEQVTVYRSYIRAFGVCRTQAWWPRAEVVGIGADDVVRPVDMDVHAVPGQYG